VVLARLLLPTAYSEIEGEIATKRGNPKKYTEDLMLRQKEMISQMKLSFAIWR
jgi:hypothetical protein